MAFTYRKIASVTVGSGGSSTIDFQNIPATYTDLVIKMSYRTNRAEIYDQMRLTFNNSSAANYDFKGITGEGDAVGSTDNTTNGTSIKVAPGGGNSATTSTFTNDEIYIPNYTGSTNKSLSSDAVGENNATKAYQSMFAGLRKVTDAINRITLTPEGAGTILQHSTATLYGISQA
jgi:hypothetical protein